MPNPIHLDAADLEPADAKAPPTLDEQLARYERHWSPVDFDRDDLQQLAVRYGRVGPQAVWFFVPAAALCIAAAALAPFLSPLDPGVNRLIALAGGVLGVVLLLAWRRHTALSLTAQGLHCAAFPPLTGPGANVPLKNIRRFKVDKNKTKGGKTYTLSCLTRDEQKLPLITHIARKDDAYLVSMLLIQRVKTLR